MNNVKIAAALRLLAEAFETPSEFRRPDDAQVDAQNAKALANSATGTTEKPAPRPRGRPAKGETPAPAAPAPAPAAPEADPFGPPPVAAGTAPTATLQDVRDALTALKAAKSQDIALKLLKDVGGAGNLSELAEGKYGAVVKAAELAMAAPLAPAAEPDPFEVPAAAPAAPAKPLTLEDVRAVLVNAQKRTSADKVQGVVMAHGGKAKNADTGIEGPSLKALPEKEYAAVIAEVNALPSTK